MNTRERPPPRHLELAARILAWERAHHAPAPATSPAIERTFHRMHDAMSKLVGSVGYQAVFTRALHLAKREHRWLDSLVISKSPFAAHEVDAHVEAVGEGPVLLGAAAAFAAILDLFCIFIGEELTLRQIHRTWTEVSSGDGHAIGPQRDTP